MTKKAERAAKIEANKLAAYHTKVNSLAGWVGPRIPADQITAAYHARTDAEIIAVDFANKTPVGAAVWAQKVEAVRSASQDAQKELDGMAAKLEAAGWDISKVAPYYERQRGESTWDYNTRKLKNNLHYEYLRLFPFVKTSYGLRREDWTVAKDEAAHIRHVEFAEKTAADQYNLFVLKLVGKLGEGVVEAALEGSHVWASSILTVRRVDGSIENWKTQQIINTSKLGLRFPQWPTRQLKGGA